MSVPSAPDVSSSMPSYGELRHVSGFARIFCSALFARTAARMYAILLVLFVLATRHSPSLAGLTVLVSMIPGIILSPVSGALLDRANKVALIAIDFLVAFLGIVALTALSLTGELSTVLLFVIVGVSSITAPLSNTGTRSLFPVMIPRHLWDLSNAVDSSGYVFATVVGPAIGGIAAAIVGAKWALGLPALLFLGASCVLIGLKVPAGQRADAGTSLWADSLSAVRYVFGHRVLRMLAFTLSFVNAGVGATTVVVPVLVLRHLHGGTTMVGVLFGVMGLSGFIVGFWVGAIGTVGRERMVLVLSGMLCSVALVSLAFSSHSLAMSILGLIVLGGGNSALSVAMFSLRQRVTDPRWFGRAFAVSMNLNAAGIPLAAAAIGSIVGHSIVLAFLIAAVFAFVGCCWPLLSPLSTEAPGDRATSVIVDARSPVS